MKTQWEKYKFLSNPHSTTGEPVGQREGPFLAKMGNDCGIQEGELVVGARGEQAELAVW